MLQRLHTFLRNEMQARRASGLINPEFITECINQASNDLWLELISKEKAGVASNLLDPFKEKLTVSIPLEGSTEKTLTGKAGYAIISAYVNNLDLRVAESDFIWGNPQPLEGEDLSFYIDESSVSSGSRILPDRFKKLIAVREGDYQGVVVEPYQFYSKDLLSTFPEGIKDSNDLINNLESETITGDNIPATVDGDFVAPVSVYVTFSGSGKTRQGFLVSPDVFNSKNIKDILSSVLNGANKNTSSHPLLAPNNPSIPQEDGSLDHIMTARFTEGTNPTPNSVSLPADFKEHLRVFYLEDGSGNRYEGQILKHNEYVDRLNSTIIPPSLEAPIGVISGESIEINYGAGASVNFIMPYIKVYDFEEIPIFTVEGGQLKSRATLDAGDVVSFSFYKHPTSRRPIATVSDGEIKVRPATNTAKVSYLNYPSSRRPMVRFFDSGSDKTVQFLPTADQAEFYAFSYKPPASAAASYSVLSNGEPSVTVSTELDWTEQAFSHIATRALFYLGQRNKDQIAINQEAQKETVEKNANN